MIESPQQEESKQARLASFAITLTDGQHVLIQSAESGKFDLTAAGMSQERVELLQRCLISQLESSKRHSIAGVCFKIWGVLRN